MLLGEDLCFLVRVVVAGFTVLFVPLFGLVLRQKWRRSAARNEEIKRLVILASEETARAEFEANHEYEYGAYSFRLEEPEPEPEQEQEVEREAYAQAEVEVHLSVPSSAHRRTQNECEVCSSPTTNRCARCKRVYYCSGKCQINHWRQGHKDECRPFDAGDQNNDIGGFLHPNPLIPPKNESYAISNGVGGRHPVKPVETNSKETAFSESLDENNDNEITHLKIERGRTPKFVAQTISDELPGVASIRKSPVNVSDMDVKTRIVSGRHQFVNKDPIEFEENRSRTDQIKPASPKDSHELSSGGRASAFKHNLGKPSPLHVNSQCGSSSSSLSGSSVDECNESSLSEPSTPSTGFWEGMNNFLGDRSDVLDDTPHLCSNDIDALDFHLSSSYHALTGNLPPCINGPNSLVRKSGDVPPAISGIKEPTSGLGSSVEINNFGMESQRVSVSERSGHADDVDNNSKEIAAPVKSKKFDSGKDAKVTSPPVKSKCEVAPRCNTFTEPKPVDVKSLLCKDSVLSLSLGNAKQTTENVKSAKAERAHMTPACKLDVHSQHKDRISSKASVWKMVDQLKAPKSSRLNPCESVGRYCDKGLFQYELFVKLYTWKVELLPCGLMNCGNSCYANVVLQCLAFTPPLTAYILQGLHSRSCKKQGWCFTCEFERLVVKAKEGHSPISPSQIISQLQHIGSHLGNGKEEDAHEFLRYAIDAMQSICLKEARVGESSSLEETTLIGLTFGGYLRSKIECMKCGGISECHEKMMDLTVEIEGDIRTLEEALRQFTRSETLDGENKYLCGRCKSSVKARKKLRVLEAPNVLTIALKRFQSGKFGKLNKTIKFPEILNMAPYMSGTSDKSPVYQLYGVVVHLDIMNAAYSGHYICYVKNSQNRWFKIDDSTVKEVELEHVLTKDAYMLLYARCSPRAPRLLRNPINPRDSKKANDTDCKSSCHPWDQSLSNLAGSSGCDERSYLLGGSVQPAGLEDDSSSFFSEGNSWSTDSSTRDSTSTEFHDQMFGDMGSYWNGSWRNSSDSETLSSTSSPSPMYLRRSSYADLDHFASRYSETSVPSIHAAVVGKARHPGSHQLEAEGNGSVPFLCSDSTKHRRNLGSNSINSRESGTRKSGWANSLDNLKSSVTFRRSSRERPD